MDITDEILKFITQAGDSAGERAVFEDLALELCRRQANRVKVYGDFCRKVGVDLEKVRNVFEIPALPQAVLKYPTARDAKTEGEYVCFFETSGTSAGKRGIRPVARIDIYEKVCVTGLLRMLDREFPELFFCNGRKNSRVKEDVLLPFFFLKENTQEAPRSSLSWMFEFWRRTLGTESSAFLLEGGRVVEDAILKQVMREPQQPVIVAGTALGLLYWAEQRGRKFLLPPNSVVIETGGFKGRRREMPKSELYRLLSEFFSLSQDRIVNEYGMTEIFSQTYARGANGLHKSPPWLLVRIIDPFTGRVCVPGQPGVLELLDLANVDHVPVLQTEDLAVERSGGFELVGRASAELRGCSLEV